MVYRPGFWARGAAFIYDVLIIFVPLKIVDWAYQLQVDAIWFNIVFVLYATILPYYFNGKTIGKHIMRMRIVNMSTGEKPTLLQMFTRCFVAYIASILTFGVFYLVSYTFIVLRKDKRALHDFMASTKVIAN